MNVTFNKIVYMVIFAIAALAGFGKFLIYAHLLSPLHFGTFTFAVIVTAVCSYFSTAGLLEGLSSRVPIMIGKREDTLEARSSGFFGAVFASVIFGLPIFTVISFWGHQVSSLYLMFCLSVFFVNTIVLSATMIDLQVRGLSMEYALVLMLKNISAPLIAVLFSKNSTAEHVLLAETLGMVICIILCFTVWCRDIKIKQFKFKKAQPFIAIGLPFTANSLLLNLSNNIDRWAVHLIFGATTLGTYSFALNFASLGHMVLNMIQLYAGPRMLSKFGKTNNISIISSQCKGIAILTLFIFGLGSIPTFIFFPIAVETWFPEYTASIELLKLVYVGAAASAIGFSDIIFRAIGKGQPLVLIQFSALISGLLACLIAYFTEMPVYTFALIFTCTRIFSTVFGWGLALRNLNNTSKRS